MSRDALVIGGSGMLSKVSLWLANSYNNVYVIGRNTEKLQKLTMGCEKIVPVSIDYKDDKRFVALRHYQCYVLKCALLISSKSLKIGQGNWYRCFALRSPAVAD
jgi:saccharopine dehydrogenase-like NADP-dependent oxidoreductase